MGRPHLPFVLIMCVLVPAYDCRMNHRTYKHQKGGFDSGFDGPRLPHTLPGYVTNVHKPENKVFVVHTPEYSMGPSEMRYASGDCQSESMKCSNMMLGIGMLVPELHTPEGLKKMCSAVGEIKACFDAVVASCPEMTKAAEQMKSSMNHFEQTCGYLGTEGETVSSQYQTECDAYGGGHGPCKHGATCESDPVTRAAICNCAGTGYTGRLCEGYTMETTTKKPEITARCPNNKSWPKLVGQSFEKAKARILHDCPKVHVQKSHHHGGMTTLEWNINRVRVYVNHSGMVVSVPQRA